MKSILDEFKQKLLDNDIVDCNTSSRGTFIWLPYGMEIKRLFIEQTRKKFLKNFFKEYSFPNIVAKDDFEKITSNIFDFSKGVFCLDDNKILRPSGEAVIYSQFKRWIKSYKDLPIKLFQIGTSFRNGTARGIFRSNEAEPFIEGHSAHSSRDEAEIQLDVNIRIVKEMLDFMGVPVILTYRPIWSNKPVGEKTIGFDTLLPTGETLLVGSAYSQMQVFSKPFNIQFRNEKNQIEYTYQTSLGFSSRMIFTSLLLSSDVKGMNLLPDIAPKQIVIIPIFNKDNYDEKIVNYANKIEEYLDKHGYRTIIDMSNKNIGNKRYINEKKGIPIRIEIGKNEIEENTIVLISRENNILKKIHVSDILNQVETMLDNSTKSIKNRIKNEHSKKIVKNLLDKENIRITIENGNVASYPLCFNPLCSKEIEFNTKGEVIGYSIKNSKTKKKCVACGKLTNTTAFQARHM